MTIRPARRADFEAIREIEIEAGRRFTAIGMEAVADDGPYSAAELEAFLEGDLAWVAVDGANVTVGYVVAGLVDNMAHIEQVSVRPSHGRQGIGTGLVEHVATWARAKGLDAVTLTTFANVPWNAPLYQRLGFQPIADERLAPGLAAIGRREAERGLDRWPRTAMIRTLHRKEDAMAEANTWGSGPAYEAYVGRWSALVAPEFLAWLGVPPGLRWLDVGCGTGILARAILASESPASVVGVDPSESFVDHARTTTDDQRVAFALGSASATGVADGAVDVVVFGLVLNFVPDVPAALAEARRVGTPGATVAAYVWDYGDGMEFIRAFWDAATSVDPSASEFDQRHRFPIAEPGALVAALTSAGLESAVGREIVVPTVFRDFDDLWRPFTGGTGQAPAYLASLDEARRSAVREAVRATVPTRPEGTIELRARAWAAKGRQPGQDA